MTEAFPSTVDEVMDVGRVKALLGILKVSDPEAYEHSISVARYVEDYLSRESCAHPGKRTEEEVSSIIMGALLHDVGKSYLPFGLQFSTGSLNEIEREIINTHPILGAAMIKECDFNEVVTNIVLLHHEAADGTGYPKIGGVTYSKENVPDYVWIVAFADRFDAMVSERSYRNNPKSLKDAWAALVKDTKNDKLPYEFAPIFKDIVINMDMFEIEYGDDEAETPDLPNVQEKEKRK